MRYILALCLLLETVFASNYDIGHACFVQYLQQKELLSESFPADSPSPHCRLVLMQVLKGYELSFKTKLENRDDVKADCVFPKLKEAGVLDRLFKIEVVTSSSLERKEAERIINEEKITVREILEKTAEACNSDSHYGGIFANVIPSHNNTLPVLQRDYCLLIYLITNDFILTNVENINPKGIDTIDLDCDTILKQDRESDIKIREKDIMKTVNSESFTNCVLDLYRTHDIYGLNASLKIIDELDTLNSEIKADRKRILHFLNEYSEGLVSCSATWSQTLEGQKFETKVKGL